MTPMDRLPVVLEQPSELETTRLVLDAIRLGARNSRSEIVRAMGVGRATVVQRVGELIDWGLIEETGIGRSTGGRPPRSLRFRSEAGYLLVADLGATSIDVATADLSSVLLEHDGETADIGSGPDVILGRVETMFAELRSRVPADAGPLLGIGIGVPGPVEFSAGRTVSPPIMPGWDRHPIRERLEGRFGVPVWVDNDVNIMAIGEWRAGIAQGHRHVVWVKIGTGIGSGLISDGVPHRGANGAAGDIGHIQIVEEGVVCRCGNVGCLEALAGGAALARDVEIAARSGRSQWLADALDNQGSLTAEDVTRGAAHGDSVCVELIQRSGRLVGHVLASVVNVFNPSMVVIGGGVSQAGDHLLATIRENVYRRSLPLATRDLQVVQTALGPRAGVIGAAAMVADELFSAQHLGATVTHLRANDRQVRAG
jgi:glucokinase-like ROK family protein